ncbi:MAG: hypothetical protein R3D66_01625 [Alphaproteobacteria bacterium]
MSNGFQGDERRVVRDHDTYFNAQFDASPVDLRPHQVACSDNPDDMIVASVGSGIFVSIYEPELKTGAACFLLLPRVLLDIFPHFDKADPESVRAALSPLENCIGEMKRRGAGKGRIRVRLTGGAAMPGDHEDRGTKNYIFAREYITRKGLPVLNEDIGGSCVRRIHFFPASGKVVRRMLHRAEDFSEVSALENSPFSE